jgi:hypothetical protein
MIARCQSGVGFRSFKLVNMAMEETLRAAEIAYGRLASSLTYYVRSNPKARNACVQPSPSPSTSGQ